MTYILATEAMVSLTDTMHVLPHGVLNAKQDSAIDNDMPEKVLLRAKLFQALYEATAKEAYMDGSCMDCHVDDLECGCPAYRVPLKRVKGAKRTDDGRIFVNVGKRNLYVSLDHAIVDGDECIIRTLLSTCKRRHTLKQCARAWLKSEDCAETCHVLGLDPGYLCKQAGVV